MRIGADAQARVNTSARIYRARGEALVSFAGPEWVDVRRAGRGRFSGIQKRGPVDYVGHDSDGRGFRFDVKASSKQPSLHLSKAHVPEHQREELAWCAKQGVPAGILAAWYPAKVLARVRWYWLPAAMLVDRDWSAVKWAEAEGLGLEVREFEDCRAPDFLDAILRL